jgi:hypothetical protein
LIVALIILVVLLLIGGAALNISNIETLIAGNDITAKQAFQAAEAASEYEAAQLKNFLATSLAYSPSISTITSSISPPSIPNYTLQNSSIVFDGTQQPKNATGTYNGLTAWCQRYIIKITTKENSGRANASVMRLVEDQLIPLFQFGVFYQNLLEIFPGAPMTFNGLIHSNANIYLGTSATLTVQQNMTAGGTISIYQPGTYHGNYFSGPVTLQSQNPGVEQLTLPVPQGIDPINMIERGTDSYRLESLSGLKIIDGIAYDKNNNVINLSSSCGSNNPVSTSTAAFYDVREGKKVDIIQIDLGKLQKCSAAYNALNSPPTGGDPGILYVSKTTGTTDLSAVRLIDGANLYNGGPSNTITLPSGLMVATDNPLYIQGDFNTTLTNTKEPVPAALASDALTILSNNWTSPTDTNSINHTSDLTYRVATNTTVNAAIMTGNVPTVDPTTGNQYSGGLENFPRFLENWSGQTLTYGGSLTCLWQSQRATGKWVNGSPVYSAPNRAWSYNMDPNNMPPGTPRVRNLQRIQWYQVRN